MHHRREEQNVDHLTALECGAGESGHKRGGWILPSLNLKILVCRHRSVILAAVFTTRNRAFVSVCRKRLNWCMRRRTASPERSSGRLDLVSRLRIETFRDRCHVAVGLIVPWVLCVGHELGVVTHWHSQTVQYTLDTANVFLDHRVLVLAQLDNLLNSPGLSQRFHLQPVDQVRDRSFQLPRRARQLRDPRCDLGKRCGTSPSTSLTSPHTTSLPTPERRSSCTDCERGEGVQGVLTFFCSGVAQTCHDDRVVELKEQLGIEEEDGEGQEEKVKEEGRGRVKENAP